MLVSNKMSTRYVKLGNKSVDRWNVTELREELKRRRLSTTGLKPDLVRRLDEAARIEMEDEENESTQSEVPVENEIADTNISERTEDVTNKGIDIVAKVDGHEVGVRRDLSSADMVQRTKSAGLEGEQVPQLSVVETTEVDKTAEPQKTSSKSNLQDYPYTTPLHSRYPRRSSGGVVPQFLASPSSGSIARNPPLKSALRILRGDRETAEAALPSQPTGNDPVFDNGVEDVKPSTSTGSTRISGPLSEHEMDLDALCAKITSQVEGSLQPPSHQDIDGNTQPPGENSEVPRDMHALGKITTTDHVPMSSQCLTPSHSLNMTEFARRLKEESDDDHDEVVSAPSLDYEYVNGHKVKIGIAQLVRAIFEKYGDITKDCKVKTPPSLFSFLLELMCDVYLTLEQKKFVDLTRDEFNVMRDDLQVCEDHKLNVGWLLERLEQISETTNSSKEYLMLKEEAAKRKESNRCIKGDVELQWRHIDSMKKKISTMEQQMVENQAVANKCTQKAIDIKTRVNTLQNRSLVHGLL